MKGLKTQESSKFVHYFSLVQETAAGQGCVFFLYAVDGNDFETGTMEGEILMGWLIPQEIASEFERIWEKDEPSDEWSDYFTWAEWETDGKTVSVRFA